MITRLILMQYRAVTLERAYDYKFEILYSRGELGRQGAGGNTIVKEL